MTWLGSLRCPMENQDLKPCLLTPSVPWDPLTTLPLGPRSHDKTPVLSVIWEAIAIVYPGGRGCLVLLQNVLTQYIAFGIQKKKKYKQASSINKQMGKISRTIHFYSSRLFQ